MTIDPPGARDLDQALHIERRGDGHRIRYAIADLAAFVAPGGAVDREAHARGVTVYAPDGKAPLHPPVLSEGAGSLLPGEWRPAILWTLDLDARGELVATDVRARGRAQRRAAHLRGRAGELGRCCARSASAGWRSSASAAACASPCPSRRSCSEDGGWTVRYRAPLPSEEHNAQISLLTGMAAARLMLDAASASCARSRRPTSARSTRLRRAAAALGVDWPDGVPYAEFIRTLDPARPNHAAVMHEAASVGRGASYTVFDGEPPADASTSRSPRLRARDRAAAAAAGPLRLRVLPRGAAPAGLGARRARRAAGRDGRRRARARTPSSAPSSTSSRPCCSPAARASASRRS